MQNQHDRTVNHQMQTQLNRTFYMPLTRMGIFLSTVFSKLSSVRGDVSLVRVRPQLSGDVRSLVGSQWRRVTGRGPGHSDPGIACVQTVIGNKN